MQRAVWLVASYQAQEKRRSLSRPSCGFIWAYYMSRIITQSDLDVASKHLTLSVSSDAVNELKKILSKDKPIGKAFTNIAKTYAFLCWMNREGNYFVYKSDLATMTYARHEDSLTKAIDILRENGLVQATKRPNLKKYTSYYTYNTFTFDYKQTSNETVVYEYDIPVCSWSPVLGKHLNDSNTDDILNIHSSFSSHIYPTDSLSEAKKIAFKSTFLGWYGELCIGNKVFAKGHFSEKDGRFYHYLHSMSKYERETTILWDGEHVVEAWDAHSAFFIVLGYYLKEVRQYESEEEKQRLVKEANDLIRMAVRNELYTHILWYHNKRSKWKESRDTIKEWVNAYKNQQYKNLFTKTGERTKYLWAKKFIYIDDFFKSHFPHVRDMILSYPRHEEYVYTDYQPWRLTKKSVSDIQRDVMPYEFQLFSLGLCKDLFDLYRIKSVTVHDAIYMKASDAEKISSSDIDELLSERLGISDKIPRSYALF